MGLPSTSHIHCSKAIIVIACMDTSSCSAFSNVAFASASTQVPTSDYAAVMITATAEVPAVAWAAAMSKGFGGRSALVSSLVLGCVCLAPAIISTALGASSAQAATATDAGWSPSLTGDSHADLVSLVVGLRSNLGWTRESWSCSHKAVTCSNLILQGANCRQSDLSCRCSALHPGCWANSPIQMVKICTGHSRGPCKSAAVWAPMPSMMQQATNVPGAPCVLQRPACLAVACLCQPPSPCCGCSHRRITPHASGGLAWASAMHVAGESAHGLLAAAAMEAWRMPRACDRQHH